LCAALIDVEVKYLVIEALTYITPEDFKLVLSAIQADPKMLFPTELDQGT
jgi:hypothetical protein